MVVHSACYLVVQKVWSLADYSVDLSVESMVGHLAASRVEQKVGRMVDLKVA